MIDERSRWAARIPAAVGLLACLASPVSACMRCNDLAIEFLCPWVWPVTLALAAWLAGGWWRWRQLSELGPDDLREPGGATPNAILCCGAALVVAFALGLPRWGPLSGLLLVVCLGWVAHLGWSLARSIGRRSWPAATRASRQLNLVGLCGAVLMGGLGWAEGGRPEAAVGLLNNPELAPWTAPGLVRSGERSVAALALLLQENTPPGQSAEVQRVVPAVWCLARIDTPAARDVLARFIERELGVDGELGSGGGSSERGTLVATCLWAETAAGAAVPVLGRLHQDSPTEAGRLIALCGLARTGDPVGIDIAIEHLGEFIPTPFGDAPTIDPETLRIARTLAGVLLASRNPKWLRRIELFGDQQRRWTEFGLPGADRERLAVPAEVQRELSTDLARRIEELEATELETVRREWKTAGGVQAAGEENETGPPGRE